MRVVVVVLAVVVALAALLGGSHDESALAAPGTEYVGSEACTKCHASIYNEFRVSGHP